VADVTATEPTLGEGAEERGAERARRARLTTLTSVGGRGLTMLLSLVSLPLTIGYLDKERYGLWVTIGSFLAWLAIADLGLGNGLANAVTTARANGDDEGAQRVVSTAFGLLVGIAIVLGGTLAITFPLVPWHRVFAVSSRVDVAELRVTIALCIAVFVASFPLGIVDRVLGACQEGYVASAWGTASTVLATVALVLAVRFGSGLPTLVVALSVVPLVVRICSTVWVFTRFHPELRPRRGAYRRDLARELLATGSTFLVVQLAALGMWQNDNIIISQLFGPAAVGPYSVAFRLATVYVGLVSMYLSPLWPAYADAHAHGEHAWIRERLRTTTRLVTAVTTVAALGMIAVGPFVIRVWTQRADMVPSRRLLVPIAVYMVLIVFCLAQAVALNGLGRIRGQMYYGTAAAILNVGLSIGLGLAIGVDGVCWATCIAALVTAVGTSVELRRALKRDGGPEVATETA
jgi:O-antigen/teichoic acid export membrane protein